MNASIAAAVVAAVLAASWLLGRRRAPLVRDGDMSAVAALNREQIALVQRGGAPHGLAAAAGDQPGSAAGLPMGPTAPPLADELSSLLSESLCAERQRLARQRTLLQLYRAGGPSRLRAIRLARRWGHPCVLPLLRQGLRDVDPAVVHESAAAIAPFRARPRPAAVHPVQRISLPRNVARSR